MTKELVTIKDGVPVTDSLTVATYFHKRHSDVITKIEQLIKEMDDIADKQLSEGGHRKMSASYFTKGEYINEQNKPQPLYYMTVDGFYLLTMGFTGKRALENKLAYIGEFNRRGEEIKRLNATVKELSEPVKPATPLIAAVSEIAPVAQQLTDLFGVHDGLAKAKAIDIVEFNHDVNLQPVKELLPPADHDVGNLNPTQIAKLLGWESPRQVNIALTRRGLQNYVGKKYVLTDAGKEYGEMCPYTRNGHTDYQIRWSRKVVDFLASVNQ